MPFILIVFSSTVLDKLGPGGFHNSVKPLLNRLKEGLRPFFRDLLESIAKNIGKTISDKLEDLIRNSKQLWMDFLDWIRAIDPVSNSLDNRRRLSMQHVLIQMLIHVQYW